LRAAERDTACRNAARHETADHHTADRDTREVLMARIGVLTSEIDSHNIGTVLDGVLSFGIHDVQLQLTSLVPEVSRREALLHGISVTADHLDADRVRYAADELSARDITVAAIDGTFNMADPDPDRRRDDLARLRRVAQFAPLLGSRLITLCTGSRSAVMWRRHPDNRSADAWRDLIATTREAVAIAQDGGLTLAFEPEFNNVVNSARSARRYLDDVDSAALKVLLDPANIFHLGDFARQTAVLEEAFDLLGADIVLAHAKDVDHEGDAGHLAAGRGRLDYATYLRLLADSGFDGALVFHQLEGLDAGEREQAFARVERQAPDGYLVPRTAR
jgi:sugar phosphate isomerase/epimerase